MDLNSLISLLTQFSGGNQSNGLMSFFNNLNQNAGNNTANAFSGNQNSSSFLPNSLNIAQLLPLLSLLSGSSSNGSSPLASLFSSFNQNQTKKETPQERTEIKNETNNKEENEIMHLNSNNKKISDYKII